MISTPLSLFLDKTLPPQAGRASQAADTTAARDFADLMSRLFISNMPVAALTRPAEIPDAMAPLPDGERIEPERRPEIVDRADWGGDTRSQDEEKTATVEARDSALPEPVTASVSDEGPPQNGDAIPPAPAFHLVQSQPQSVPGIVAPTAQQAADRPLTQSAPALVQAKEAETPPAAPQQGRHAQAGAGDLPRAQVVDGSAKDQPPPLGHMLSGRTAVVAQSDDGAAVPFKDAAAILKGGNTDQPAAELFGGAAQATSSAAQKLKGQSKPAGPGGPAQIAGSAPSAQTPGAQAQQIAAPAQATAQSSFDSALAGVSTGSGQPGGLSSQTPRSEPLPLVGSGGQQSPQTNFRTAETAAASKPRMPVPQRFIADQVAVQIQKSLGRGNDRISIQLQPAELGKVEVRLDVGHEGRVTAVITADRADTLDLLQRDARILQHSLQDAGLRADSNSLSFELRSQGQAFDNGQNGPGSMAGSAEANADDGAPLDRGPPPARPAIVTNDRVDIHV